METITVTNEIIKSLETMKNSDLLVKLLKQFTKNPKNSNNTKQ